MATEVETQSLEQRAEMVSAEAGSEDEAINAFNQRVQSQAQQADDQPADEPQDLEATEPEQGEPEAEIEPAEELVEVEFEGETVKVSPKAKDALLRQADYSRHMNELSATKKDYAQRIESADKLIEGAEHHAKVLAQLQVIESQIDQFKTIDFDRLEIEDPQRAAILGLKLVRLQGARDKAVSDAEKVSAQLADGRAKDMSAKQSDMFKALKKDLPGWGDELGGKITQYALSSGYSAEELQRFTDPRVVIALDKARKFDAIQAGRSAAQGKVKDAPPVVKPGAPRRVDVRQEAMARFQKSNSPEDAEAVFQARAAARR